MGANTGHLENMLFPLYERHFIGSLKLQEDAVYGTISISYNKDIVLIIVNHEMCNNVISYL